MNTLEKKLKGYALSSHFDFEYNPKASDGWYSFQYFKVHWQDQEYSYDIEVFPEFKDEKISNWILGASKYQSTNGGRYFYSKRFINEKSLESLEPMINSDLLTSIKTEMHRIERSEMKYSAIESS